jgi:hypothetical protein
MTLWNGNNSDQEEGVISVVDKRKEEQVAEINSAIYWIKIMTLCNLPK